VAVSALALGEALAGIVGPDGLLTRPAALEGAAVDGVRPSWVALPRSAEEVGRLLALATEERLAVCPRGSGSAFDLGNPPRRLDLVLDLSRLAAVLAHEPEDLTATFQCGIRLSSLQERLGKERQFLPLDPLGAPGRSLGGVLATDASGPLGCRYGTARDLLLGVRFVQADGTLTWGGARVVKSVTGYDVPKLMVGALGTLGVLVEATLRLHPLPEAEETWLAAFDSADAAGAFLAAVLDSTLEPSRLELCAAPPRPEEAVVAISFGSAAAAVRAQGERAAAMARRQGGRVAAAPERFWSDLGAPLAEAPVRLKVSTLIAETASVLDEVRRLARREGASLVVAAEAARGVLHVGLGGAGEPARWERGIVNPLRERLAPAGGGVVVERAPRALKERLDVWGALDEGTLGIARRVKAEFDPLGILNPGRSVGRL
jgi:glycolate oxidase FAD binding subunit